MKRLVQNPGVKQDVVVTRFELPGGLTPICKVGSGENPGGESERDEGVSVVVIPALAARSSHQADPDLISASTLVQWRHRVKSENQENPLDST